MDYKMASDLHTFHKPMNPVIVITFVLSLFLLGFAILALQIFIANKKRSKKK